MKRQVDEVARTLDSLAAEFPEKGDFKDLCKEMEEFLRNQDLPPRDVERILRLLRMRTQEFIRVSDALQKWSFFNGR